MSQTSAGSTSSARIRSPRLCWLNWFLLLGAYLIIDDVLAKRDQRRWNLAAARQVANLETRVGVLANDFEAAIEALDDEVAWQRYRESVWWFRLAVGRSQSILTMTAELASMWASAEELAHVAEWFASRDPARLPDELGQTVPQQSRRAFPVLARQLRQQTAAFREQL